VSAAGGSAAAAAAIVLASASATRAALLEHAGITAERVPAAIDESEIKRAFQAERRGVDECAAALAEAKAMLVSRHRPGALVIGADQILECGGAWFDKPPDRDQARAQLLALRGKRHVLATAVCVVLDGSPLWRAVERPALTMRAFSDTFLDWYLDRAGDAAVLGSVGAYQLEGLGAQLFARVEGDYFSILGLPMLPLLDFLRGHGVVPR
jgi:septum formation protein